MIIKLNNKTLKGAMVMGLSLMAVSGLTFHQFNSSKKVTTISLGELPKDIERQPVPVTGKVRDLSPPAFGEHHHPK